MARRLLPSLAFRRRLASLGRRWVAEGASEELVLDWLDLRSVAIGETIEVRDIAESMWHSFGYSLYNQLGKDGNAFYHRMEAFRLARTRPSIEDYIGTFIDAAFVVDNAAVTLEMLEAFWARWGQATKEERRRVQFVIPEFLDRLGERQIPTRTAQLSALLLGLKDVADQVSGHVLASDLLRSIQNR